jgi:hypothetical protein
LDGSQLVGRRTHLPGAPLPAGPAPSTPTPPLGEGSCENINENRIRFGSGLDPASGLFAEWIRYQDPGSVKTGVAEEGIVRLPGFTPITFS